METVELYAKAAAQGHADAQYRLGVCYAGGRGVAQDKAKAKLLFQQAANAGPHWRAVQAGPVPLVQYYNVIWARLVLETSFLGPVAPHTRFRLSARTGFTLSGGG